jgi:esterase/lipase
MKALKIFLGILLCLVIVFLLGPKVDAPNLELNTTAQNIDPRNLDSFIQNKESQHSNLKPGNEAKIVWANPSKKTTEYSIVYLHGFSASHEEGNGIHQAFADRYGANLYLARLEGHGIKDEDDGMGTLTADGLIQSAYEAIQIGKTLGNKVIVISCSTGSTLALYLASLNNDIHALFNYSANVEVVATEILVFTKPWGMQIGRMVAGSEYHEWEASAEAKKYWNTKYRLEALAQLRHLLDYTMTKDVFSKIKQPVFNALYNEDPTVSADAIREMHEQLGSAQKVLKEFPKCESHMMISKIHSKDLDAILESSFDFAEGVLGMRKVEKVDAVLVE